MYFWVCFCVCERERGSYTCILLRICMHVYMSNIITENVLIDTGHASVAFYSLIHNFKNILRMKNDGASPSSEDFAEKYFVGRARDVDCFHKMRHVTFCCTTSWMWNFSRGTFTRYPCLYVYVCLRVCQVIEGLSQCQRFLS